MREYVVNRPDVDAMRRILEREQVGAEAVILRLAWFQGLSREEIAGLTWSQVSFLDDRLELPDRRIPLHPEMRSCLWRLYQAHGEVSTYVVLSSRGHLPLRPESISRLARLALDREGQTNVRLMDLRHDWIIRQLQEKDWPTVARISGIEIAALQVRFSAFVSEKSPVPRSEPVPVDEFKLWKILQTERDSPAGLALWLTSQLGLQAQEIVALTWEQVDFRRDMLCLPDREVPMTQTIRRLLEDVHQRRLPEEPPYVVLTSKSRRPVDLPRLSRMTRAALIRGDLEDVLPRNLRRDENREDEDSRILNAAASSGVLSRGDVMELLGISKTAAYVRLHRLVEGGRLVRIGGKYYPAGTVVPPERHLETIRAYLERMGFAYRQDVANLLHIRPTQCGQLLRRFVNAGELCQVGQKYCLPQTEERKAE